MSIKARLRSLLRPVVKPIWYRVWARIETRLRPIEARLDRLGPIEARLDQIDAAWRAHSPAFLNAVSTVGAFGHRLAECRKEVDRLGNELVQARSDTDTLRGELVQAQSDTEGFQRDFTQTRREVEHFEQSLWQLRDRVEFARREVLFEMAYGGSAEARSRRGEQLEPRVIAQDKLQAVRAAGDVRLNLGCGHIPLPGYLNVDRRELPGVDIVAEADRLPFERGAVREIFSAHLVEHFPQEAMRRRLLPYWRDLLREGGIFRAVTPDAAAMIAAVGQGDYSFDEFREVLFGAQDYEGDYHYNLLSPDSMRALLEEAGFHNIEVQASGRRNGKCFEFEIIAVRL